MSRQLDYYYRRGKFLRQRKALTRKTKRKHVLQSVNRRIGKTSTEAISPKLIRIHALAVLFQLAEPLTAFQVEGKLINAKIPFRKEDRGYFFDLLGIRACISTKAVTIWGNEKDVPNSQKSLEKGYIEIESEIAIGIKNTNILLELWQSVPSGTVIENHVAFVMDEGAVQAVKNHEKIMIPDKQDGKARFLVDQSTGEPEAEFVHKKHAKGDSLLYAEMVEDVTANGGWREMKADLKLIIEALSRQTDKISKIEEKL